MQNLNKILNITSNINLTQFQRLIDTAVITQFPPVHRKITNVPITLLLNSTVAKINSFEFHKLTYQDGDITLLILRPVGIELYINLIIIIIILLKCFTKPNHSDLKWSLFFLLPLAKCILSTFQPKLYPILLQYSLVAPDKILKTGNH